MRQGRQPVFVDLDPGFGRLALPGRCNFTYCCSRVCFCLSSYNYFYSVNRTNNCSSFSDPNLLVPSVLLLYTIAKKCVLLTIIALGTLLATVLDSTVMSAEGGFSLASPLVYWYGHTNVNENEDLFKHLTTKLVGIHISYVIIDWPYFTVAL